MAKHNEKPFITFSRWVYNWSDFLFPVAGIFLGIALLGIGIEVYSLMFVGFSICILILAAISVAMYSSLRIILSGLDEIGIPTILDRHSDNVSGRDQEGDQRGT